MWYLISSLLKWEIPSRYSKFHFLDISLNKQIFGHFLHFCTPQWSFILLSTIFNYYFGNFFIFILYFGLDFGRFSLKMTQNSVIFHFPPPKKKWRTILILHFTFCVRSTIPQELSLNVSRRLDNINRLNVIFNFILT